MNRKRDLNLILENYQEVYQNEWLEKTGFKVLLPSEYKMVYVNLTSLYDDTAEWAEWSVEKITPAGNVSGTGRIHSTYPGRVPLFVEELKDEKAEKSIVILTSSLVRLNPKLKNLNKKQNIALKYNTEFDDIPYPTKRALYQAGGMEAYLIPVKSYKQTVSKETDSVMRDFIDNL